MHKSLDEFDFQPIRPLTTELHDIERLKINIYCCQHSSSFSFDRIFFSFAGHKENHKVSDNFEILKDPTMDRGVSCP